MGSITVFKGNVLPSFLVADDADNTEFSHGAGEGFGVLSYRGKVWRLKHKGEEHVITRSGDAVPSLRMVLLRANKEYSKIYYSKKYAEGDDQAPDCFSNDGVAPDPSVERPQCKTCSACPMNVWGSRVTDEGKKAKACQDSRRVAVLLVDDSLDISTDEPVMLRIPPASLAELKTYADGMAKANVPLWKVITQVGFDIQTSFPRLVFKAYGWDESQIDHWREMREGETVRRILAASESNVEHVSAKGAAVHAPVVNAADTGEDDDDDIPWKTPETAPQPSKAETPAPAPKPRKPATRAAKPAAVVSPPEDDDAPIDPEGLDPDEIVNSLLGKG